MLDKLLLQRAVHVLRLADYQQPARPHVQPMGYDAAGIALLHDGFDAVLLDTPGHRQHAAGLVDHHQPLVLVDDGNLQPLETQ